MLDVFSAVFQSYIVVIVIYLLTDVIARLCVRVY